MKKEYRESEIRAHYRALTLWLIEQKLTITTMESATAGQIASLITDTEGSSAVLKGAFVTYCNEAKIQQGVPADVIDTYTVYSKETAAAMAEVCRESYQADIGVGVTGTMGNIDPANPDASVPGQVYFAVSTKMGTESFYRELAPQTLRKKSMKRLPLKFFRGACRDRAAGKRRIIKVLFRVSLRCRAGA